MWLNLQVSNAHRLLLLSSDLKSVCIFLTILKALSQSALLFGNTSKVMANLERRLNLFPSTLHISPQKCSMSLSSSHFAVNSSHKLSPKRCLLTSISEKTWETRMNFKAILNTYTIPVFPGQNRWSWQIPCQMTGTPCDKKITGYRSI